ncbi:MAG: sigma-54-dependent Fis family transcriptional regulator, partial [bacterium]|nr:sigma-54-dependent Fis family transcriptional regulator [bacterium]
SSSTCGLVVQSPAMWQVWDRVQLFAEHDTPVLVLGETGTGKELVARAIHQLSARGSGPVVAVASGAVPRDLAESEFFGHEKGAFTGALRLRMGSFERADGGSLLLDDVDDLPLDIQVKLLRVLQEGRIQRVGGNREITVDVRVIATSKVKLQEAVAAGRFREDLYYRLRGLEIILPPLRDRGDEVLVLAQHFLRELGARQGTEPKSLSVAAAESLRRHSWPGNVRELRRVMESATALCRGPEISPAHLPEALSLDQGVSRLFTLHLDNSAELAFQDLVQQVEDELVDWAVRKAAGRQNRAAEILGLPRTTFQTKLGRRKAENSD